MTTPPGLPPTDPKAGKEALVHFASAFVFLLLGIGALVWNSGRLAAGSFGDPRVLGGLHWLTLGWLSISIFGAVRVFTGVALGSRGSHLNLAPSILVVWATGAVLFPSGLMIQVPALIVSGVLLIGTALLLYTIHMIPALVHATRGGTTRWYLTVALVSLWCAWFLGGAAAFVRAGHPLGLLPPGYLQAHLMIAIFGWVGATVVGVGSHLIPMFALSRQPTQWPVKVALPLWAATPVLAVIGAFHPVPFLRIAWIAIFAASVLWIIQVVIYFQTRLRREPDPGLLLAAGATVLLGVSWIVLEFTSAPVAFVGLLVVGWLTLFTLGIYHRVVPFLAWYQRFARGSGRGPIPRVKDLSNDRLAYMTAAACLSGALLWEGGLLIEVPVLVYGGSTLILLGAASTLGQIRWLIGKSSNPAKAVPTMVASGTPVVKGGFVP